MKKKIGFTFAFFVLNLFSSGVIFAQYGSGAVTLPYESQRATVAQRIGLTDIEIIYHRPAVKNRTIWGDVVPYNNGTPMPWRGGANENTTISFSTDVTVEGKPLAAGTYGLHFIPSATDWIVIFSKNSTSWGSFSYDKSEDALRVSVKPQPISATEYLTYQFDDPKPSGVTLSLRWDKLSVPISISVDLGKTVIESIKRELRSTASFSWKGYYSAAKYCADNNFNLNEALDWIDQSIDDERHFDNIEMKSELLRKLGRSSEADSTLNSALSMGSATEITSYGRHLIRDKQQTKAMEIFKYNVKNHPDEWISYSGLARGYEAAGDLDSAIAQMNIALSKAPDTMKGYIASTITSLKAKQNK